MSRNERLAAVACLSPRQFTRVFRDETGRSPAKAVEKLRLQKAKLLLEQGRLPVEMVAKEAGFGDRERMRRAFLRGFGQPPQALRKNAGVRPGDSMVVLRNGCLLLGINARFDENIRTKPKRSIALESVALRQKRTRAQIALQRAPRRFSGNTTRPNLTTSKAVCSPLIGSAPRAGGYSLVNSS
jgi:AraC-like DNA-binding protein